MRFSLAWLLGALASALAAPPNSVVITNLVSTAAVNRPFTISRVFALGEIPNFAQARVSGSAVLTQCDVKTRWPDGSLKHALVSFRGTLPANGSLTVDFVNQTSGNNTGHLASTADMLAPSWMSGSPSWNAEVVINGGTPVTKNVRTMLGRLAVGAGQVRYWMQGPIVTQVIVEDRTSALSEDFGLDANKSLHPIFVLTFYNGWQGVKVEYILENAWTTKLQDQIYALTLRAGATLTDVYTKGSFTHYLKTRWHKTYWSGQDPDHDSSGNATTSIDFNRAHMSYSRAIPNYDPAKRPTSSAISTAIANFNKTDRGDINGYGQYYKVFSTTGGREEIGLYPAWEARYLTTFDPGMYRVVMGNADVSGHIPIHLRESDAALGGGTYFGRVVSLNARPTGPSVTPLATGADSGWRVDLSHQAAFAFIPYILTGDWYWLEELQFWATADGFWGDPRACSYCRNGSMGIVTQPNQPRGIAWAFRNIAHAAYATPDADTADKAYFVQLMNNNLGAYEGKLDIQDGAFNGTPQWKFGHDVIAPNGDGGKIGLLPDTLGFIVYNSSCNQSNMASNGVDPAKVSYCDAPWQVNYLNASLGRIVELGFAADKLLAKNSLELIHTVLDPAVGNPFLAGAYEAPRTLASNKLWISDWATYGDGFLATQRAKTSWNAVAPSSDDNNPDNGYPQLARGAASFVTGVTSGGFSGQAAYDWLNTHMNTSVLNDNPKWAFVPRTTSPATSNPCDATGDGVVDVSDVQAEINAVLGIGNTSVDLNQNGRADVVDVQRIINTSLGAACRVGP
jgi:hypothetical protein